MYKVEQIPEENVEYAQQYLVNRTFRFMAQVNSAIALPKENEKYEVVIRIAEKEISTGQAVFNKGRYNRFNYRTKVDEAEF